MVTRLFMEFTDASTALFHYYVSTSGISCCGKSPATLLKWKKIEKQKEGEDEPRLYRQICKWTLNGTGE